MQSVPQYSFQFLTTGGCPGCLLRIDHTFASAK